MEDTKEGWVQEVSRQMSQQATDLTKDMPDEMKVHLRKWMMETQPKVKAPKKAFHATRLENLHSVLNGGIKAHEAFGEIYLCDTLEDCLKFIPRPCVVFEVNTKALLPKRWRLSLDHQKNYYNCEVYCYFGDISPANIKQVIQVGEA
jgi:hypothetical protein